MHKVVIPYSDEPTSLEGFAAYPSEEKHPAVILCHAWKGRDEFICEKAEAIANWGYVGFALDIGWEHHIWYHHVNRIQLERVDFFPSATSVERYFQKTQEVMTDLAFGDFTLKARFDF